MFGVWRLGIDFGWVLVRVGIRVGILGLCLGLGIGV